MKLVYFFLTFCMIILLSFGISLASGCAIGTAEAYFNEKCLGDSETWYWLYSYRFGGDRHVCAIGHYVDDYDKPVDWYAYVHPDIEYDCNNYTSYLGGWNILWKYVEGGGDWPDDIDLTDEAYEGFKCRVRWLTPGVYQDMCTSSFLGEWDSDEESCVSCLGSKQLTRITCIDQKETSVPATCEEACGAVPECDEYSPNDPGLCPNLLPGSYCTLDCECYNVPTTCDDVGGTCIDRPICNSLPGKTCHSLSNRLCDVDFDCCCYDRSTTTTSTHSTTSSIITTTIFFWGDRTPPRPLGLVDFVLIVFVLTVAILVLILAFLKYYSKKI